MASFSTPKSVKQGLSALLLALSFSPALAQSAQVIGDRAQEFALRDMDGDYVSITAHRGKVILLNFWATWCPPCVEEMPALEKLHGKYAGKGFEVLAVASDSSVESIRDFLKKTPVSYTVMADRESKVTKLYRVSSIPVSFLIDRRGIVVRKFIGPQDWESPEITALMEDLLHTDVELGPTIPAARPAPDFPFPKKNR